MHSESEQQRESEGNDPEDHHADRARTQAVQAQASRRGFLAAGGTALGLGGLPRLQNPVVRKPLRTDSDPSMTRQTETVTLETAKQIIEAAEQKARDIGVPSVITVANPEGNLVAQHRMEDAWLPSVSISRQKAYTAAGLELPTHALAAPSRPGESLYGLQDADDGRLVIFGGGYPLQKDGEVVGAIASSGGQVEQDREVAQAGVAKFEELVG